MRLSKVLKTLRSQLQRKPSLNPTLTAQNPPPSRGLIPGPHHHAHTAACD